MTDYRFKVEIELDDDKIISENKYDKDGIYDTIRSLFKEKGIAEKPFDGKTMVFYSSRQDEQIYGEFALLKCGLIMADWIRPYIKKMYWYNADYSDDYCEDVLAIHLKLG